MDLNTPLLAGAVLAWFVRRPSGDGALDRARANRGTLIASGLIAGGALAGVLDALVKAAREWLGRPEGEPSVAVPRRRRQLGRACGVLRAGRVRVPGRAAREGVGGGGADDPDVTPAPACYLEICSSSCLTCAASGTFGANSRNLFRSALILPSSSIRAGLFGSFSALNNPMFACAR